MDYAIYPVSGGKKVYMKFFIQVGRINEHKTIKYISQSLLVLSTRNGQIIVYFLKVHLKK